MLYREEPPPTLTSRRGAGGSRTPEPLGLASILAEGGEAVHSEVIGQMVDWGPTPTAHQ